jgi:mono/diheme cytochrome c family protein
MLRGLTIIGGAAAGAVLAILLVVIIQVYWFERGDEDAAGQSEAIAAAMTAAGFGTMVATTDLGVANARVGLGAGLGVEATPEQIARVNISIPPDGRNLPPGQGTVAEGETIFVATCAECHGVAGAGGQGLVRLTGGLGTLTAEQPIKTVSSFWPYATTLFDYIRRAMPLNAPQSLTDEQVYAVTAYILSVDAIVPADAVMDATTLPLVEMPNRNGFVNWWPGPPGAAVAAPAG